MEDKLPRAEAGETAEPSRMDSAISVLDSKSFQGMANAL